MQPVKMAAAARLAIFLLLTPALLFGQARVVEESERGLKDGRIEIADEYVKTAERVGLKGGVEEEEVIRVEEEEVIRPLLKSLCGVSQLCSGGGGGGALRALLSGRGGREALAVLNEAAVRKAMELEGVEAGSADGRALLALAKGTGGGGEGGEERLGAAGRTGRQIGCQTAWSTRIVGESYYRKRNLAPRNYAWCHFRLVSKQSVCRLHRS